jgi:hypothetical protein
VNSLFPAQLFLRLLAALLLTPLVSSRLAAQGVVVLDTFGPASSGRLVAGSSWEGQVAREGEFLVVAGAARDDNGWQARGLNVDATGMKELVVTGFRRSDNAAGMLVIELQDSALNTAVFATPLTALGTTSSTVRIPLRGWPAGFAFTRITGWSIGGGVPPPGNDAFRVVLEHLELSAEDAPLLASLPVITVAPVDQAAPLDAEVRFSVAAVGTPTPSFQWRREGQPIFGATGAVLPVKVTADTVGRYSVAVGNSVGSVLSVPVLLSVGMGTPAVVAGGAGAGSTVSAPAGGAAGSAAASATSGGAGSTGGGGSGFGSTLAAGGAPAGSSAGSNPATPPGSSVPGSLLAGGSGGTPVGGAVSGSGSALLTGGSSPAGVAGAGGGSAFNAGAGLGAGSDAGTESRLPSEGSVAGAYFGTLPDGGVWALNVRGDRRGMFLAHFPSTGSAAIAEVTVGADNRFQVTGTTVAPRGVVAAAPSGPATASAPVSFTLRAQVSAESATGELLGFSLAAPADRGPFAAAGLYRAQALYANEGSAFVIVGPSGRLLAVTASAQAVDAATGTVSGEGGFRAWSRRGADVRLAFNAGDRSLNLAYAGGDSDRTTLFHGLRDTEVATLALANLSVRTVVGADERSLVAGFALAGGGKPILVRGIGPSLAEFGVEGVLSDPRLELRRPGAAGSLAGNDDWNEQEGRVFPRVGAFALRPGSRDAALLADLEASTYTAHLGELAGGSGVALLELYDAGAPTGGRLTNLSARSSVSPDGGALIAGFNLTGTGTRRLLIRAVGPTLASFGLEGVLSDPRLELYPAGGSVPLATNQDWSPVLAETFRQVGAFALPEGSWDAAFVVTLPAGSYTAQVGSADGSSGIALVEIYELP